MANFQKARTLRVPVGLDDTKMTPSDAELAKLIGDLGSPERTTQVRLFIAALYDVYKLLHFTYLEINPLGEKKRSKMGKKKIALVIERILFF